MYKAAFILYLVCFFLYILFSRQPDYFDSDFTKGVVVARGTHSKSVQYREGSTTFSIPIEGWGASKVAVGDTVEVIFDPSDPAHGAMYSFFSYWLTLAELLISAMAFVVLFAVAVIITGRQEEYYYTEEEKRKKRKYKD